MKNTLFAVCFLVAALALSSCSKYNIQGSSDLQDIDGRMLYLKDMVDTKVVSIDSCDMVHGKFQFSGSLDSVRVVTLCIDNQPVIPVVLEDGEITISLNSQQQTCNGTPLNDSLSVFNQRYRQLAAQIDDLVHAQNQAIMNGEDMDVVNRKLSLKEEEIMAEEDRLVTNFITANFNNCLGPFVFQIATGGYKYPVLTPWIEALMTTATAEFKNDPYVKEYMEVAEHNRNIMSGMAEPTPSLPSNLPQGNVPTPNELAK